nr:hypothetical protein 1 [Micrococcaceae bacterium]
MFEVELYDKDRVRRNSLGAFESGSVTVGRWAGEASFTIPKNTAQPRLDLIAERGTRVRILDEGEPVMTGVITHRSGKGPVNPTTGFTVASDVRVLQDVLAWPVPAGSLSAQSVEYRTVTGPLETVVKTVLGENVARLGYPLTVAPNQGRGPTVTVQWRFHSVFERLKALLEQHNAMVDVLMGADGVLVAEYRPGRTIAKPFDILSGTLSSWEWEDQPPTVTRVVVGGQGEGTARKLVSVVDVQRETLWKTVIEHFVDARDIEGTADQPLLDRGWEYLAEGKEKTGVKLGLVSTRERPYGVGYRVGDLVTVKTGDSRDSLTAPLSGVTITQDGNGRRVEPTVDTIESNYSGMYRLMSRMDRNLRTLMRR